VTTGKRASDTAKRVQWLELHPHLKFPCLDGSLMMDSKQRELAKDLIDLMKADGLYAKSTYWPDALSGLGEALHIVAFRNLPHGGSKEVQVAKAKKKTSVVLVNNTEVTDEELERCRDILYAFAYAIRRNEPTATQTILQFRSAADGLPSTVEEWLEEFPNGK